MAGVWDFHGTAYLSTFLPAQCMGGYEVKDLTGKENLHSYYLRDLPAASPTGCGLCLVTVVVAAAML